MSCQDMGTGGGGGRNITSGLSFVLVHKRKCNVSAELFGLSVKRFLFALSIGLGAGIQYTPPPRCSH